MAAVLEVVQFRASGVDVTAYVLSDGSRAIAADSLEQLRAAWAQGVPLTDAEREQLRRWTRA